MRRLRTSTAKWLRIRWRAKRRAVAALVVAAAAIATGCEDHTKDLENGFESPVGVSDPAGLRFVLSNHFVPESKMDCMFDKLMATAVTQTQMGSNKYWWESETLNAVAAECGVKVTKRGT